MKAAIAAVVIGLVLAVGAMALGAKWVGASPSPSRTIAVTGESRLVGEPDTALVMFGVEKSGKTVAEGQQRVSDLITKIIAALRDAGVKKEDVATSSLRISQGWDYRKNVPRGYTLNSTLTITVRNVQHVGRVVDTAVANGLNRLEGVSYDVRNREWHDKALREAIGDARDKAEKMSAAAGRHLGRVVYLGEQSEWQTSPEEEYYGQSRVYHQEAMVARRVAARPAMPQTRALPGHRALTVQVAVAYEL